MRAYVVATIACLLALAMPVIAADWKEVVVDAKNDTKKYNIDIEKVYFKREGGMLLVKIVLSDKLPTPAYPVEKYIVKAQLDTRGDEKVDYEVGLYVGKDGNVYGLYRAYENGVLIETGKPNKLEVNGNEIVVGVNENRVRIEKDVGVKAVASYELSTVEGENVIDETEMKVVKEETEVTGKGESITGRVIEVTPVNDPVRMVTLILVIMNVLLTAFVLRKVIETKETITAG